MVSRLNFHSVSVVVVLALVLGETLVESQFFMEETQPVYLYNPEGKEDSFLVPPQGRSLSSQGAQEEQSQFASRRGLARSYDSDEDDDDDDDEVKPAASRSQSSVTGRSRPVKLPPGFDERVRKRMKMNRKGKLPLHGDPENIHDDDEDGRQPESRLLWPFSVEITKGAKDKGWGPGGHGSNARPSGSQYGRIGIHKGRFHPEHTHFHASSGWGQHNGWGWDAFIEHEKHRLKYEILKLKAKKKIAVLQNKVELKKLFSMLLQKKIQALEWCYHDWIAQQSGWGGGPSWGWGGGWGGGPGVSHPYGWKPGDLTDEEILNSKHYKKYRKKKKKKIKKLKKKLKFKRLVQKILQKHITYLDKIAPY